MNLAMVIGAALCAVNAPRARTALPEEDRGAIAVLGAVLSLAVLAAVAVAAGPVTDALHLTVPTVRMAVGVVLLLQGAAVLVLPAPGPEPRLAGRGAALVPLAFPVLLTPGLGLLVLSTALDRSAPVAVAVAAVALLTVPALARTRSTAPGTVGRRVLVAAASAVGGLLVLAGVALVIDGLFDL